jgi:glutamyl-tRNA synthetase
LSLRVKDNNERARRFYKRLGFTATDPREPLSNRPSGAAIEMRLALPATRLRFAPSPAGDLHVGHVRSGVLTWILAQQQLGRYYVRFENTDRAKEVPGSRDAIVADLNWLGLQGSEDPHDQAELTDSHRTALEHLSSAGHVYEDGGAVRFRTPSEGTVEWDDLVRGRITVRNVDLDDPVIVRSSGSPTFYLASTVDDVDDGITHMIRADPLRRSTATQMHIWRSLGHEPPRVGHVSLVTAANTSPVRTGSTTFTIRSLRDRGISPTALLMYLAMPETASWKTPPPTLDSIIDRIDFRRLPRRPMTFDLRALELLNRRYARLQSQWGVSITDDCGG